MPVFEYEAIDARGAIQKGSIIGPDPQSVQQRLSNQGWEVRSVTASAFAGDPLNQPKINAIPTQSGPTPLQDQFDHVALYKYASKAPLPALAFFFRQFGAMLNAGVNPIQCFETLSKQTTSSTLSAILRESKEAALQGKPFSEVIRHHPHVFSPLILSLVVAGEKGGTLEHQCHIIANYIEEELELRRFIRSQTLYPKLLVGASILIIGGANLIISSIRPDSPIRLFSPLTEPRTWLWLAPIIIILFLFNRFGIRQAGIRARWDALLLKIPGFRKISHGFAMAKFSNSFGALYKGGIPIVDAVRYAADSCGNQETRRLVYPAADALKEGNGIADSFAATGAFSQIILDMVATGERTGDMDKMMESCAKFYEQETKVLAKQYATIISVLVLLGVCIYIGMIVISFWSGYFGAVFNAAGV